MTTKQHVYIKCIKRPIDFLGALMAIIVTSPILLTASVLLFFANRPRGGQGQRAKLFGKIAI